MHTHHLSAWRHDHPFGDDTVRAEFTDFERRRGAGLLLDARGDSPLDGGNPALRSVGDTPFRLG
jgi:hypothetical protein